jgi:hypothetical protein
MLFAAIFLHKSLANKFLRFLSDQIFKSFFFGREKVSPRHFPDVIDEQLFVKKKTSIELHIRIQRQNMLQQPPALYHNHRRQF